MFFGNHKLSHTSVIWLVLLIFVIIGRGIMQKPRAQIINFENNRNINKSIVFIHCWFTTLLHVFVVPYGMWITSGIHYDGEALKLSCCKDITNHVLPSLTHVVLVSLYSIIILSISQFTTAKWYELLYKSFSSHAVRQPPVINSFWPRFSWAFFSQSFNNISWGCVTLQFYGNISPKIPL